MPSHSRTTASYGYDHRTTRARLLPTALGTRCPGAVVLGQPWRSPRCDQVMTNPHRIHLDHTTARALGGGGGANLRLCCAPCNLGAGAALGNKLHPRGPGARSAAAARALPRW